MIKDKKNMKKRWKRIISNMIAIALVIKTSIQTISIPVKAEASVDGKLITVGGKTVTKNMKIDDVKKMFGEPKLTTPSYWDGYAYTFYGKDYSDYLYLETDSHGKRINTVMERKLILMLGQVVRRKTMMASYML